MKGKISLLVGGAVGYVLGARAGRERYEQIRSQAQGLWNNPKVQEKAGQAQDLARQQAPLLKDKAAGAASGAASAAKDKVSGGSDSEPDTHSDTHSDTLSDTGTAPYPTSASTGI